VTAGFVTAVENVASAVKLLKMLSTASNASLGRS
jgi:hypothetical protein